jgi:hypothetical protein
MRRGVPADARLLAYHEAGHAVAAYVLKRPLGSVSLHQPESPPPESPPPLSPQPEVLTPEPPAPELEDAERDVIVLLAGVEAEALLTGDFDWWAAEADRERAEALLGRMLAAGYRAEPRDAQEAELGSALRGEPSRYAWEILRHRAHALMQQAPVCSAIAALATALLSESTLDPHEVQRVIRQGIAAADPDLV